MIKESTQSWKVGEEVKVGIFGTSKVKPLRVVEVRSIKDGLPDIYILENLEGTRKYEFIPYNGLRKLNGEDPSEPVKRPRRPKRARTHKAHKETQEMKKEDRKEVSLWSKLVSAFKD